MKQSDDMPSVRSDNHPALEPFTKAGFDKKIADLIAADDHVSVRFHAVIACVTDTVSGAGYSDRRVSLVSFSSHICKHLAPSPDGRRHPASHTDAPPTHQEIRG